MYCLQSELFWVQEDIDVVAGDLNNAYWRRKADPEKQNDSTLEETFKKNAKLLDLLGPTHYCGALVEHHMNGLMCAGLSSHLHLNSLQRTRQATTRRGSISVM